MTYIEHVITELETVEIRLVTLQLALEGCSYHHKSVDVKAIQEAFTRLTGCRAHLTATLEILERFATPFGERDPDNEVPPAATLVGVSRRKP